MGEYNPITRKLELRSEEALFLLERGVIELWKEAEQGHKVTMSVQQGWQLIIGCDDLTLERFQVPCPPHPGELLTREST